MGDPLDLDGEAARHLATLVTLTHYGNHDQAAAYILDLPVGALGRVVGHAVGTLVGVLEQDAEDEDIDPDELVAAFVQSLTIGEPL